MKKVLFFGIYDPTYSRNRVLMRGFRENSWEVGECRMNPKIIFGFKKYWQLWQKGKLLRKEKFDLVIVAFPGHSVVWLARLLFGRNIIFDAFVSLYNSEIEDRQKFRRFSLRGAYYYFLDWHSVHFASRVLLDTNTHIKHFAKHLCVPEQKFIRVFVGSDINI